MSGLTQIAQSGPVRSGPVWSGLVRSDPVWSGMVRSGPVLSGPVRSRPVPSGPVPSCPVSTRRIPTHSAPSRPVPLPSRPVPLPSRPVPLPSRPVPLTSGLTPIIQSGSVRSHPVSFRPVPFVPSRLSRLDPSYYNPFRPVPSCAFTVPSRPVLCRAEPSGSAVTHLEALHEGPEQDADGVALAEQLDETRGAKQPQEAQVDGAGHLLEVSTDSHSAGDSNRLSRTSSCQRASVDRPDRQSFIRRPEMTPV